MMSASTFRLVYTIEYHQIQSFDLEEFESILLEYFFQVTCLAYVNLIICPL